MIIWFNCKITDQRLNPQYKIRYNLRDDDRLDVAKYSFASYVPLEPLVSKFIFNLELADACAGREQELEAWLRKILPENKLDIRWYRCDQPEQWQGILDEMDAQGETLIYPAGNDDHIFLDHDINTFKQGLELISQDPNPYAVFMTSHYPESIRAAHYYDGTLSDDSNFVSYYMHNNDAIRVMKVEYFKWYVETAKNYNLKAFKTEHWNNVGLQRNKIYVPTKEQFRHFDGYPHVYIGPETCPPLEIPTGFFDGMTIRYGFDEREPNCVNINPRTEDLYTVNPKSGTDYKFTLNTLPAFWRGYIKEIISAPGIDVKDLDYHYDLYLLDLIRINSVWNHVGAEFNDTNRPPSSWINNHTQTCLFVD